MANRFFILTVFYQKQFLSSYATNVLFLIENRVYIFVKINLFVNLIFG